MSNILFFIKKITTKNVDLWNMPNCKNIYKVYQFWLSTQYNVHQISHNSWINNSMIMFNGCIHPIFKKFLWFNQRHFFFFFGLPLKNCKNLVEVLALFEMNHIMFWLISTCRLNKNVINILNPSFQMLSQTFPWFAWICLVIQHQDKII